MSADFPQPALPHTTARAKPEGNFSRIVALEYTREIKESRTSCRPIKNSFRALIAAICWTRSISNGVPSGNGGNYGVRLGLREKADRDRRIYIYIYMLIIVNGVEEKNEISRYERYSC